MASSFLRTIVANARSILVVPWYKDYHARVDAAMRDCVGATNTKHQQWQSTKAQNVTLRTKGSHISYPTMLIWQKSRKAISTIEKTFHLTGISKNIM